MGSLAFSTWQDSDVKRDLDDFFQKSSSSKRLSTKTQMIELYHVVMEKHEFQHSAETKLEIICIEEHKNAVEKLFEKY